MQWRDESCALFYNRVTLFSWGLYRYPRNPLFWRVTQRGIPPSIPPPFRKKRVRLALGKRKIKRVKKNDLRGPQGWKVVGPVPLPPKNWPATLPLTRYKRSGTGLTIFFSSLNSSDMWISPFSQSVGLNIGSGTLVHCETAKPEKTSLEASTPRKGSSKRRSLRHDWENCPPQIQTFGNRSYYFSQPQLVRYVNQSVRQSVE